MKLDLEDLALPLVHPFTIARGSIPVSHTLAATLAATSRDGRTIEGLGETSPTPRYGESADDVRAWFAEHPPRARDPYAIAALLDGVPPAARCALDLAIHDWIGKDVGRPLWQLLGLDPGATPATSFTVGIDSLERVLTKIDEVRERPIVKLKLGGGADDVAIVEAVRDRYRGTLRVDANEAWTPEEAVRILRELERFDIEFCEQPIPAGAPEKLRFISERTRVPLMADEDAVRAEDLPALAGCVHGVNLKVVKCGGLRATLEAIHVARALGFKIMLGCMVESAILTSGAAQLSPLVDYADLDGPFLTASDPFEGVTYGPDAKLLLADRPGLGVARRVAVASAGPATGAAP